MDTNTARTLDIRTQNLPNRDVAYRVITDRNEEFQLLRELGYPFHWRLIQLKPGIAGAPSSQVEITRRQYRHDLFEVISTGQFEQARN